MSSTRRDTFLLSRTISLPQLSRMSLEAIPWTPLRRPVAGATVAIVTTSGTHLVADRPFDLASDATFRVIPRTAVAAELTISHLAYDRRDALRFLNRPGLDGDFRSRRMEE